ncbi:hypothetical protein GGS23DRAFT_537655 [Durotheca rogersii]|uniref:uncharacterized protein n=1 Tax=Durotheca rogersii TaxID=419775 RepID=UPI002220B616|nr:uncharacterized protein GGS23DRAFT_537655 [Durotheca rogersii]KAI5863515.1 hypothetical protein GGS23DRAFT_537655 [Durotheca rogersii]
MSSRPPFSAAVSSDGSRQQKPAASYNLDAYLRSPPASLTERLVAGRTPATWENYPDSKRAELKSWEDIFSGARK